MPTVDDPNNDKSRLQSTREQIDALPPEDARLVRYWLNNEADAHSPSTKINHISHLLTIHDELDTGFADADKYAWTNAIAALAERRDWTSGTKRNYQKSVRSLLEDIEGDVAADKDDISLSKDDSGGKIDEEDILSLEEVRLLINEASNRVRDKAMFSVMIDLGLRIGAVCSLRVRDFEFEEGDSVAEVTLNDDALGQKGSGGRTHVVTYSAGYIRNYLRTEHPRPDEADAPLFHKIGRHYDADDLNDDGSISPTIFRRRMKRLAKDTDIDPEKLHPHNMKHAAVTIWALRGMSDREIEYRAGWARESGQLKRYEHLTGDDINAQILDTFGVERAEGDGRTVAPIDNCPNCGMAVDGGMRYCPQCGQQIDISVLPDWFETLREELGDEHDAVEHLLDAPSSIPDEPQNLPQRYLNIHQETLERVIGGIRSVKAEEMAHYDLPRENADGVVHVRLPYETLQANPDMDEVTVRTLDDGRVELLDENNEVVGTTDPLGVDR